MSFKILFILPLENLCSMLNFPSVSILVSVFLCVYTHTHINLFHWLKLPICTIICPQFYQVYSVDTIHVQKVSGRQWLTDEPPSIKQLWGQPRLDLLYLLTCPIHPHPPNTPGWAVWPPALKNMNICVGCNTGLLGFPGGSVVKGALANAEDVGSAPG